MKLFIPDHIQERLVPPLKRAGNREIGGILMGEFLAEGAFRLAELTIQEKGGSSNNFIRDSEEHLLALDAFFERHHDYARFNYLGEWHSHPNHITFPSLEDQLTMHGIVDEPDEAARPNFAVLLIIKLIESKRLHSRAFAFFQGSLVFQNIEIIIEENVQ